MESSSGLVSQANPTTASDKPKSPHGNDLGVFADLFRARIAEANALLVGPDNLVENMVSLVVSDLKPTATIRRQNEELRLPTASTGMRTAVIFDVDGLTPVEQRRLLDWLVSGPNRTQVVSTTSAPLLPLVETGVFNDTLYYRLNTTYVDLSSVFL
jgi:hypothetical protein